MGPEGESDKGIAAAISAARQAGMIMTAMAERIKTKLSGR